MSFVAVQIGLAVAGTVLNALFAPKPPPQEGPRLNDLNLPAVSPGNSVNRVYGSVSVGVQLFWTTGLKETVHTEKVKGGKGGPKSQKVTTYTYSSDVACSVCEGPVTRVRRIWANNKVLFSARTVFGPEATGVVNAANLAASLSAGAHDRIGDVATDANNSVLKKGEKERLRTYMQQVSTGYPTIVAQAAVAGLPSSALTEAKNDLDDYIAALNPPLDSNSNTDINKTTFRETFEAWATELDTISDNMRLAAVGSSNSFLDGEAVTEAGDIVGGLPPELVGGGTFGNIANALKKKKKKDSEEKGKDRYTRINVYTGTESQEPDDIMEAEEGVGMVPAYRGVCYFVIDDLQLADFGNTLPTFKVEVQSGDADGTVELRDIVINECQRAGLEADEYNVMALPARRVKGLAITRVSSARDVLEIVRNVHHFDAVESNYQMKFIWRYDKLRARIRPSDLSAREYDNDPPAPIETTRTQDEELPKEIVLTYQDPSRDYSIGTARAKRQVTSNNEVKQIELPMSLDPVEAKTAVEQLMSGMYAARRSYKLFLPIKYGILDPGDAVVMPTIAGQPEKKLRIAAMQIGANHVMQVDLIDHVPPIAGLEAIAYVQPNEPSEGKTLGSTEAYLLDIPILTETEDDNIPGFYVAFAKDAEGWPGGVLFIDIGSGGVTPTPGGDVIDDGEAQWEAVAGSSIDIPHAITTNAFTAASAYLWDRTSRVGVYVTTPGFVPSSIPEATLLRSTSNSLVVNGEIMQYATVIDRGDGVYELRDFIRGRRGSETMIAAHAEGSDAIFINESGLQRYNHAVAQIGEEQDYKSANANEDISDIDEFQFTPQGVSLMPLAPCHVRRETDGTDITLSWLPRVRQGGLWVDGTDPAIDQSVEKYEVDIYDGATFKRTLTVDGAREVVYTSAQQTTDFGGTPGEGEMTIRVYQIGAVVGRGFTNPINL